MKIKSDGLFFVVMAGELDAMGCTIYGPLDIITENYMHGRGSIDCQIFHSLETARLTAHLLDKQAALRNTQHAAAKFRAAIKWMKKDQFELLSGDALDSMQVAK